MTTTCVQDHHSTTTTHARDPHSMVTTHGRSCCVTATTRAQGHHTTTSTHAQSPCAMMSTHARYDDESTGPLHQRRAHIAPVPRQPHGHTTLPAMTTCAPSPCVTTTMQAHSP